jgi:hypothetical protein
VRQPGPSRNSRHRIGERSTTAMLLITEPVPHSFYDS